MDIGLKRLFKRTFIHGTLRSARAKYKLARWTERDQRMSEFYRDFLVPGDLCFDVGANVGNRVKIFLEIGARVVAVEPQENCIRILRSAFGRNRHFTLVEKAAGTAEGTADMFIADSDTISSLSREWVQAVSESGRFSERKWDHTETVMVTTLDRLIGLYGSPAFIKVDVEGFEYEVLRGLSRPVKALSFEFTPECVDSTTLCLDHLERLGMARTNYSPAESMGWALAAWVDCQQMVRFLTRLRGDTNVWGDVYVRSGDA